EEARRVLEGGAFGEGHLYNTLVRLPGADDPVVLPHRNASPLPFLDHFGIGLFDELSNSRKRLAPPITELLDPRIDQPRGRVCSFFFFRTALRILHSRDLTFSERI